MLTTAGSQAEAERLAQILLKKKVAACINLVPRAESWYWWKGKVETSHEILLLIKTSSPHLNALTRLVKAQHSYQVPELIALDLFWIEKDYLKWLRESMETT